MPAILLLFLKKWWPYIVIGIAVLMVYGYIKTLQYEVKHYKAAAESYKTALNDLKTAQEAAIQTLKAKSEQQTASYASSLKSSFATIDAQQKVIQEKINENKKLKSIVVDAATRELLNGSAKDRPNTEDSTAKAKPGNDAEAGPGNTDLGHVVSVVNQNNANHLKCIQQVEEWQQFWTEFATNINGPN